MILFEQAAHTPSLWCTISGTDLHPDFLPIVVTRTRGLPLTLSLRSFRLGDNAWDAGLEAEWGARLGTSCASWLTAPVLRRVVRLIFEDGFQAEDFKLCSRFLTHPMPALDDLTILAVSSGQVAQDVTLRNLPYKTTDISQSTLRHLSLKNCNIRESATRALLTSNITHLTIASSHGTSHRFEKLYPSLACMVHLEEFTLTNEFPTLEDYVGSPEFVRLPSYLRKIQISAGFHESNSNVLDDCLRFVTHLVIPPTAYAQVNLAGRDLEIDSDDSEEDEDEDEEWLDPSLLDVTLAAFFAADGTATNFRPRELNISYGVCRIDYAKARPFSPPRLFPKTSPGGRQFHLKCLCCHCPNSLLLDRIKQLPLSLLECISFQFSSWWFDNPGRDLWKQLLSATNVQNVSVEWTDSYCDDVWDAMSVPMPTSDVLFPLLETIVIHDEGPSLELFKRNYSRVAATLIDMLHTRNDRRVPVHKIFVDEKLRHWSFWSLVAEITPVTFFTPQSRD